MLHIDQHNITQLSEVRKYKIMSWFLSVMLLHTVPEAAVTYSQGSETQVQLNPKPRTSYLPRKLNPNLQFLLQQFPQRAPTVRRSRHSESQP